MTPKTMEKRLAVGTTRVHFPRYAETISQGTPAVASAASTVPETLDAKAFSILPRVQ